jgi:lipopolysaccharide/colanic/teichoic acid biosynthesis glycosyltransferase
VRLKRIFDIVAAAAVLAVTSPLWLVARIVVKRDSPGPVVYRALRIGRNGVPFTMYKFRTMVDDPLGVAVTAGGDPRVTRSGRWLRAAKIDELPQLVNVVRGEMSLVGPRPEAPEYVQTYTDEQRRVLAVRPGITSIATVRFRDEERLLSGLGDELEDHYLSVVLPAKLKLELDYLDNRTFWSDFGVLIDTVVAIFRR